MKVILIFCCLLFMFKGCSENSATNPEILKINLKMSKEETHDRLREIGQLEKEEKRQQEVWLLKDNDAYSHLIVAYNKDTNLVRFITAVAKENGRGVRYSEVIDIAKSEHITAGNNQIYTLKVPASNSHSEYIIKVTGTDPNFLKYYSLEKAE